MKEVIAGLPSAAGVYFFYDEHERLIYVGKSINIRKRVQQHFTGKDRKSVKIQLFTKRIAFEVMGSELISLIYESDLIKKHQPIYNRSQRRVVYQYGLYLKEINGYKALVIDKITTEKDEITSFSTLKEAKTALFHITEKYNSVRKSTDSIKVLPLVFNTKLKNVMALVLIKSPQQIIIFELMNFFPKLPSKNLLDYLKYPAEQKMKQAWFI